MSVDKPTHLVPNPDYEAWVAKDQQILNYLLSSISKEILVQVGTCSTTSQLWKVIQDMSASQSRRGIINTRMALAIVQKGSSTIAEFFSHMKSLANDMAAVGKKLRTRRSPPTSSSTSTWTSTPSSPPWQCMWSR